MNFTRRRLCGHLDLQVQTEFGGSFDEPFRKRDRVAAVDEEAIDVASAMEHATDLCESRDGTGAFLEGVAMKIERTALC